MSARYFFSRPFILSGKKFLTVKVPQNKIQPLETQNTVKYTIFKRFSSFFPLFFFSKIGISRWRTTKGKRELIKKQPSFFPRPLPVSIFYFTLFLYLFLFFRSVIFGPRLKVPIYPPGFKCQTKQSQFEISKKNNTEKKN